jgi:hypothetical protein
MLGLFGCLAAAPPKKQPILDNEAFFIDAFLKYHFIVPHGISNDAYLKGHFITSKGIITSDTPLVINEKLSLKQLLYTNMSEFTADLIQEAKKLKDKKLVEAVRDLCAKNSSESTIDEIGTLSIKHVVLTEEKKKAMFESKGWEIFEQIYPKSPGIIELSRPGFSKDGTVAVIYMGQFGNMNVGAGQLSVFVKKNGEWVDSGIRIGNAWMT